jgi:GR25 family glycosyltransferase involved in LPS biosynthesis
MVINKKQARYNMTKMLVTIAYGNYWERYGEHFESMCAALDEQPDRLVIITDKPITTKYENVVYIPNSGFNDYTIGAYRQKALAICDCDWFIQFDIDDIMYPNYISNLNENVDWHVFNIKNNDGVRLTLDHSVSNFYNLSYFSFGGILNSAIKTKKLKEIGGYKTTFGWEDLILSCDLIHNKATYYVDDDSIIRGERLMFNEGSITKAPDEIRQRKSDETQVYYNGLKTMNRKQEIQRLYKMILNREADESGLKHYLNSNKSLYDIQYELWHSDEFKNKLNLSVIDPTPINNSIPIFIINLKRRLDRKISVENKLKNLGITNYEFIEAVDALELSKEDIKTQYNKKEYKELTLPEIACALSHIKVYNKILQDNIKYAIVLEDDAILNVEFKKFITRFNASNTHDFDFLLLGYHSSNQSFNGKLKTFEADVKMIETNSIIYLSSSIDNIDDITLHRPSYPSMSLDYVSGAYCYMISHNGCKNALRINYPVMVEADNIWNYYHKEVSTLLANPLLSSRPLDEDSDLRNARSSDLTCEKFNARINHVDFGR